MTAEDPRTLSPWERATTAAALLAVDPAGLGGIAIRARAGPVRDRLLETLENCFPDAAPTRRLPLNIRDERLLGGLDLAATLKAGKPVMQRGLLADAERGMLIIPSAERVDAGTIARIAAVMDRRDSECFAVVALDEGIEPEERPREALRDRMAFHVALDGIGHRDAVDEQASVADHRTARALLPTIAMPDDTYAALSSCALAIGVESARAVIFAARAARASAAGDGRAIVTDEDIARAAQLVLAPRATRLPAETDDEPSEPDQKNDDESNNTPDDTPEPDTMPEAEELAEMILAAVKAAIPAGLLAQLKADAARAKAAQSSGKAGAVKKSMHRGRPTGVRQGEIRHGARLNVIETLRAAALWQPLRRREALARGGAGAGPSRRIEVRKEDFRITRFKDQTDTTTIFVVDASGSSALHRLAEVKGAIELLLADCYVRRDSVAMIAFRGKTAELILPPTRSLVRAKRALAGLPGGGATPVALALDAAFALADSLQRKGQTPTVIMLTDGRANIGRDGKPGRPNAEAEALDAARNFIGGRIRSLVIDTSPQAAEQSRRLACGMGAIYLPLPHADAASLSKAVRAVTDDGGHATTG